MHFAAQKGKLSQQAQVDSVRTEILRTLDVLKDHPVRKAEKRASCAIVIHCHTKDLKPIEKYSLDYSMAILGPRDYFFTIPESLDDAYYVSNFKNAAIVRFPDEHFTSRETHSLLYMSEMLYKHFASTHEFMLILQTDAIVLRDELDYWCSQPWDYIGAPWPEPLFDQKLLLDRDCFSGSGNER